ncbi:TPA: hypothetical protein ACQJXC_003206, partial [Raoultella ornithinolytica]
RGSTQNKPARLRVFSQLNASTRQSVCVLLVFAVVVIAQTAENISDLAVFGPDVLFGHIATLSCQLIE